MITSHAFCCFFASKWLKSIIHVSSTSCNLLVARVGFKVRARVRLRVGVGNRVRVRAGGGVRAELRLQLGLG